jgi:hypothetical protein
MKKDAGKLAGFNKSLYLCNRKNDTALSSSG